MSRLVAYATALIAALTFAISAVLQQRSARQVPQDESMRPAMVLDLLRRKAWLAGVGSMVLAYVFQAVALGFGPVAVVEPIVASELIFAVPIAVHRAGRRPGRREWAGMMSAALGVAVFLIAASPSGGTSEPDVAHWLIGFVPSAVLGGALVIVARRTDGPLRAGLLAAAAGLSFGLLSLLTKSALGVLSSSGVVGLIESWHPWALFALGALGFFIGQSGFQAAPLASSLPVMDTIEPISAVVLSGLVLGEQIQLAPIHIVGELLGALGVVVGLFLLGRSPLVLAIYESTEREKRRDRRRADRSPAKVQ